MKRLEVVQTGGRGHLPGTRSGSAARLLLDAAGAILHATPKAAELLEKPLGELIGASFGICLQTMTRMEIDVVVPRRRHKLLTARAIPADWAPGHTEVLLETLEQPSSLAEAAHKAMAEAGRLLKDPAVTFTVQHVPGTPAIPETCELIQRSLALLLELAATPRGAVSVCALPEAGSDSMLLLRFTPAGEGGTEPGPHLPWSTDPFTLASQTGSRVTCQFDYPVTSLILHVPRPGRQNPGEPSGMASTPLWEA